MDHFEMVEKLRQKTQVSYEDAKSALEACDWDLLDALVYLEQQGKLQNEHKASYSTKKVPARPRSKPLIIAAVYSSGCLTCWSAWSTA